MTAPEGPNPVSHDERSADTASGGRDRVPAPARSTVNGPDTRAGIGALLVEVVKERFFRELRGTPVGALPPVEGVGRYAAPADVTGGGDVGGIISCRSGVAIPQCRISRRSGPTPSPSGATLRGGRVQRRAELAPARGERDTRLGRHRRMSVPHVSTGTERERGSPARWTTRDCGDVVRHQLVRSSWSGSRRGSRSMGPHREIGGRVCGRRTAGLPDGGRSPPDARHLRRAAEEGGGPERRLVRHRGIAAPLPTRNDAPNVAHSHATSAGAA